MEIKRKKINISLNKATPTELTIDALQKQLKDIGLGCQYTKPENLEIFKAQVLGDFPEGKIQTFSIMKPNIDASNLLGADNNAYLGLTKSSDGNWEPGGDGMGFSAELEYIQYPTHFDYLVSNSNFLGKKGEPSVNTGRFDTVDAIKGLFVEVGVKASSNLVDGLDKATLESILSNAIAPLNDNTKDLSDYNHTDSRVLFLIENYNVNTGEADGIGVLTIDWSLTIKNYKEKKTELKHDTNLTVNVRSVLYDSVDVLMSDYNFALSHFKAKSFCKIIPPNPDKVIIFDNKPPAVADTFHKGLPKISTENYVEVIILHSADIQNIGCLDNTESAVTSKYSKSVTSGFTFSMAQKFSSELSFSAGILLVKGAMKFAFEISFTEQWNNSQTETMEFTVPAGKKAFTYQGFLQSSILRYDACSGTYKYMENGQFLTNILKTSDNPIVD